MYIVPCLDCEQEVDLRPGPKQEQKITCPHCGAELEVVSLQPLTLDWAYHGPVWNLDFFENKYFRTLPGSS